MTFSYRWFRHACILILTIAAISLSACGKPAIDDLPDLIPTGAGPTLTQSPTATPDPTAVAEATLATLIPPALALPDASGATIICDANALRISLSGVSGDRLRVASRIDHMDDWLYLIIDGGLYRASQTNLNEGNLGLEPLLLPGWQVAGRPMQELTDLSIHPPMPQSTRSIKRAMSSATISPAKRQHSRSGPPLTQMNPMVFPINSLL